MPERAVPVILYRVVGAAEEDVRDLGPAILCRLLQNEKNPVLFCAPLIFHNERVQMVVPALTTLFSRAIGYLGGNIIPGAWPDLTDKLDEIIVRLTSPGKL